MKWPSLKSTKTGYPRGYTGFTAPTNATVSSAQGRRRRYSLVGGLEGSGPCVSV